MAATRVSFIGAPLDLGAGRRGVDMGPSAFRVAEIQKRVRDLGYEVEDLGDVEVAIPETHDPGDPRLKYLKEIRHTCRRLPCRCPLNRPSPAFACNEFRPQAVLSSASGRWLMSKKQRSPHSCLKGLSSH